MSDKINFWTKIVTRTLHINDGQFSSSRRDNNYKHICTSPRNRVSKYIKQTLKELKGNREL